MNPYTQDEAILEKATEALKHATNIRIEIAETLLAGQDANFIADALLNIGPYKGVHVEVKRHGPQAHVGTLINQIQRLPTPAVLVADYINPKMADKLKHENIQFMDTVGNAYINLEPIYIFITGKKQNKDYIAPFRNKTNRAFEPKGLMVTYGFLTNPNLLNRPFREIAAVTGVALGTVGLVVKALTAGQFIHMEARNKHRRITNYQKLLDRWVAAWPEKLRPKHHIGTFATDDPHWWKHVDIENYGGHWGGETAAALYTHYLKPEVTTAYIPLYKQAKLIGDMRLRKAEKIDLLRKTEAIVELYTPFWLQEDEVVNPIEQNDTPFGNPNDHEYLSTIKEPGLVHPVLAYADLIATEDIRNIEVARKLYDERIAQFSRED